MPSAFLFNPEELEEWWLDDFYNHIMPSAFLFNPEELEERWLDDFYNHIMPSAFYFHSFCKHILSDSVYLKKSFTKTKEYANRRDLL